MSRGTTVPFDNARFSEAASKRGTTARQIQRDYGVGNSYFSLRASKSGSIHLKDARFLERVYGITPDEYAPLPKESKPKAEPLDTIALRKMFREVVKDGINERFSDGEFIKAQQASIRAAVRFVMMDERNAIIQAVTDAVKAALE